MLLTVNINLKAVKPEAEICVVLCKFIINPISPKQILLKTKKDNDIVVLCVGDTGFEPVTPCL
jgi:hypothetical protein